MSTVTAWNPYTENNIKSLEAVQRQTVHKCDTFDDPTWSGYSCNKKSDDSMHDVLQNPQ